MHGCLKNFSIALKNIMVSHSFHERNIDNPKLLFTSKQVKWGLRLDNAGVRESLKYDKIPYLDHLVVIKIPDVTEG